MMYCIELYLTWVIVRLLWKYHYDEIYTPARQGFLWFHPDPWIVADILHFTIMIIIPFLYGRF